MKLKRKIKSLYRNHRELVLHNKNLIIAGVCSLLVEAYFSQLYAQHDGRNNAANSLFTLLIEYTIDTPVLAVLFYRDNKSRYEDPLTGKKDSKMIKEDIKKLFAAFSITEFVYCVTKVSLQYQLLHNTSLQAYEAATLSSLAAWGSFFILINTTIVAMKLSKTQTFRSAEKEEQMAPV
jgi:hypothetical protein